MTQHRIKAVFIGAKGVGKSTLLRRIITKKFEREFLPTSGVDYCKYECKQKQVNVKYDIYDCGGDRRYKSVIRSYYKQAEVIFLVFSLQEKQSLQELSSFISDIRYENMGKDINFVLIGNKADLKMIENNEIQDFQREYGLEQYHEISTKNDQINVLVDQIFTFTNLKVNTKSDTELDKKNKIKRQLPVSMEKPANPKCVLVIGILFVIVFLFCFIYIKSAIDEIQNRQSQRRFAKETLDNFLEDEQEIKIVNGEKKQQIIKTKSSRRVDL